jgi:large subunit ribosomal protein L6
MVMIQEIKNKVTIPEGVTANFDKGILTVKGTHGEISKPFSNAKIELKINNNLIELRSENVRRKEKALFGTYLAHINNMVRGVSKGFEYHMKTVFSHFPIKTTVEGNDFVIQNFLGERSPRKAKIIEGVKVEIKGDDILITGIDKEKIGQTVANIERATRVKNRDARVFQDGVYRTSKGER